MNRRLTAHSAFRVRIIQSLLSLMLVVAGADSLGSAGLLLAAPPDSGSIRGDVVYVADATKPWRLGRYYIRNPRTGELAEAVVALTDRELREPDADRAQRQVTIDQKNFQFIPETVAIQTGDSVRFTNSDDQSHNVNLAHSRHSFNITMPVLGEHVETFMHACEIRQPYRIGCVFHAAMRCWVFVFDHPWYAVTDKEGAFELKGIPPGKYRLDVVHPAGELQAREMVEVVAGSETIVRFELKASDKKN